MSVKIDCCCWIIIIIISLMICEIVFFQRKIDLKWLKKIIVNRISMLKMFDVLKNDPKMIIIIIILLFHDIKKWWKRIQWWKFNQTIYDWDIKWKKSIILSLSLFLVNFSIFLIKMKNFIKMQIFFSFNFMINH